jgi:hypothetical protein
MTDAEDVRLDLPVELWTILLSCAVLGALHSLRDGAAPIGSVDFLSWPIFREQNEAPVPDGIYQVMAGIDEIDLRAISVIQNRLAAVMGYLLGGVESGRDRRV